MNQTIIGTGLSGLVGSRVVELLRQEYSFEDISRKTGTDITDKAAVLSRIQASSSPVVLHVAAYTDVETAEEEKDLKEESAAWRINVEGTRNIVDACKATGKKLIALSTDMVFPGDKQLPEKYKEDDKRWPSNWYATTKYEAEKVIEGSDSAWSILRIAYPYRAHFTKNDSVRIFLSKLRNNEPIRAVTDHYFTPTFIDDLARVLDLFIKEEHPGVFHVTGGRAVSPFEIATDVAKAFGLDSSLISPVTRAQFFQGRAERPFNLSLSSAKIESLGVRLHSFAEGLHILEEQNA